MYEMIAAVIGVLTAPILYLLGRQHYTQKKVNDTIEIMKQDIAQLHISRAVQEAQLIDIKEDIHNIMKKLDKIYDKIS